MVNAQQAAENWVAGLGNANKKMTDGINATTVAPTQLAIAAIPRQVAGVIRAAQEGKTEAGLARVSLQDWKNAMLTKGVQRVSSGAAAAKGKFANFMGEFLPHVQSVVAGLPPRGDTEQNIQRAVEMMRGNARFRRRA
jgi:hypothetical protein